MGESEDSKVMDMLFILECCLKNIPDVARERLRSMDRGKVYWMREAFKEAHELAEEIYTEKVFENAVQKET